MSAARDLTLSLGGRWQGSSGQARCPAHDDRSPSLSLTDGEDRVLVHCFAGCEQGAVIDALKRRKLWAEPSDQSSTTTLKTRDRPARKSDPGNQLAARQMWGEAGPADGTVTELYLRGRGISVPLPPTIRHHRCLRHADTGLVFSGMIAAVQDSQGHVQAVQRTFLAGDKKASVSRVKMALGPVSGGAVRLAEASDTLILAEGIEDALSLIQMTGHAAWAVLGASNFLNFTPPAGIATIVLAPDADPAGDGKVGPAAERFRKAGLEVAWLRPPNGRDWNDCVADFDERAGIHEFDGGQSRVDAELAAFAEIIGGRLS